MKPVQNGICTVHLSKELEKLLKVTPESLKIIYFMGGKKTSKFVS